MISSWLIVLAVLGLILAIWAWAVQGPAWRALRTVARWLLRSVARLLIWVGCWGCKYDSRSPDAIEEVVQILAFTLAPNAALTIFAAGERDLDADPAAQFLYAVSMFLALAGLWQIGWSRSMDDHNSLYFNHPTGRLARLSFVVTFVLALVMVALYQSHQLPGQELPIALAASSAKPDTFSQTNTAK